ncbi:MAG: hypothetical protein ACREKH_19180, partial [Candidatus Rokuibacteriota bacterium]
MTARKAAPATEEGDARRLLALYQAPGYLDTSKAVAALWLLGKLDDLNIVHEAGIIEPADLDGWCRAICTDAIRDGLLAAETAIRRAAIGPEGGDTIPGPRNPASEPLG